MTLKELLTVLITISIGISPGLAWNPNIHRYESYDLERGPVFYEAYYPDSGDETRGNYQEKRYLDRGAVVERSYQVPSDQLYPENALQADGYRSTSGRLPRANGYIDRDPLERNAQQTERAPLSRQDYKTLNNLPGYQRDSPTSEDKPGTDRFPSDANDPDSLDIREISSIARRAISRDLENWSMLENYLDRVKYQNQPPSYQQLAPTRPEIRAGFNPMEGPVRGGETFKGVYEEGRASGRFYEEMPGDDSSRFHGRIELPEEQRSQGVMGKSTRNGNSFEAFDRTGYQDQIGERNRPESPDETAAELNGSPLGISNSRNPQGIPTRAIDSYPRENIFEPRPQVINYVFSKKSNRSPDNAVQSVPAPRETLPRNYGDNLIQDEIKKTEETTGKDNKDVSITSIKVSEEPRHKTRHHHGEWTKRDYSHRRQP